MIFAPAMTPSLSHENYVFQLQVELFFKLGEAPFASSSLHLFNPFSQKRAGNTATIHAPKSIRKPLKITYSYFENPYILQVHSPFPVEDLQLILIGHHDFRGRSRPGTTGLANNAPNAPVVAPDAILVNKVSVPYIDLILVSRDTRGTSFM